MQGGTKTNYIDWEKQQKGHLKIGWKEFQNQFLEFNMITLQRVSEHADGPLQQTFEVQGMSYTFGVNEIKSLEDSIASAILTAASAYDSKDRVREIGRT